jgi:hypothetical protein
MRVEERARRKMNQKSLILEGSKAPKALILEGWSLL